MIDPDAVVADDLDSRHAIEQGTIDDGVAVGDDAEARSRAGEGVLSPRAGLRSSGPSRSISARQGAVSHDGEHGLCLAIQV